MRLLLKNKIVLSQSGEDLGAVFDHQVVHSLRVTIRTPHDSTELSSCLQEVPLLVLEDTCEDPRVVYRIKSHPILLGLDPLVKVFQHLF